MTAVEISTFSGGILEASILPVEASPEITALEKASLFSRKRSF